MSALFEHPERLTDRILDDLWGATEGPFYKCDLTAALAGALLDAPVDLSTVSLEDVRRVLLDRLTRTSRSGVREPRHGGEG